MSFSENDAIDKQTRDLMEISMKIFRNIVKRLLKHKGNDNTTNTDFEVILSTLQKIYIVHILENLPEDEKEMAMISLFSCVLAVYIPEMDRDRAEAAFNDVFNSWNEFREDRGI